MHNASFPAVTLSSHFIFCLPSHIYTKLCLLVFISVFRTKDGSVDYFTLQSRQITSTSFLHKHLADLKYRWAKANNLFFNHRLPETCLLGLSSLKGQLFGTKLYHITHSHANKYHYMHMTSITTKVLKCM